MKTKIDRCKRAFREKIMKRSFFKIKILFVIACIFLAGCKLETGGLMTGDDLAEVTLKDGVYKGVYSLKPFGDSKSIVTVKDGKLHDIEVPSYQLGKYKVRYRYKLNALPKKMVENQSVVVDSVTCATHSSFCIMQAVQDAVNKSIENTKMEKKG
jgi:uncharacterized protein with FMN-binding domain